MNEFCGCCAGTEPLTPKSIVNRPGLPALVYRVGMHGSFLETMRARLSTLGIAVDLNGPVEHPSGSEQIIYPLQGLTTRAAHDPAIALLDAWALVADVLTFYQERIANEGYLRTATERRSILELARLVGYILRPGVAASTYLAYTLEKDHDVTLLPGNRAQSLPGPGELPQSFETVEKLEARFAWNTLKPRLTRPQFIAILQEEAGRIKQINCASLYLLGTATKLKIGDPLLFVFKDDGFRLYFDRVATVEPEPVENRTKVTLQSKPSPAHADGVQTMMLVPQPVRELPTEERPVGLKNLVASLSHPPSIPPVNAQRLDRRVSQSFSIQSDIPIQVLKKVNALLGARLDGAFAYAPVTPSSLGPFGLDCVAAFRIKAALFGHNVPAAIFDLKGLEVYLERGLSNLRAVANMLPLDGYYDQIAAGSWIAIENQVASFEVDHPPFYRVDHVRTITLSPRDLLSEKGVEPLIDSEGHVELRAFIQQTPELSSLALATKITLLILDKPWLKLPQEYTPEELHILLRTTSIYAQSECLPLADAPVTELLQAADKTQTGTANTQEDEIELDGLYPDLKSGRWAVVSGELADTPGVVVSELVMLAEVSQDVATVPDPTGKEKKIALPGDKLHTFLRLANPLAYKYRRDTVTIYGNVVRATHGETRSEVLGSGDGSKTLQQFALRQAPLTYLAAPNPKGAESTLEVRVNDILWHETDNLAALGPTDRYYVTETGDDGKTTVKFGNGQYGARPSTGVENVKAVYRTGIGKAGNVKVGQISLLATRPLGVKSVINPVAATGGADPEGRDQARRNAPLGVMAVDRLVSVQDYEYFARVYAGIGKASAKQLTKGRHQIVHLTIAGAENIPIDKGSDLYRNLRQSLLKFGDPNQPLEVAICEVDLLVISANIRLLPDYLWESVESKIRTALLDTFSFERRELGQPVFQSEVISTIQKVPGVAYVDLDVLGKVDQEDLVMALDAVRELVRQGKLDPKDATSELLNQLKLTDAAKPVNVNLATPGTPTPEDPYPILPAHIAFLSPDIPDTLILVELPNEQRP